MFWATVSDGSRLKGLEDEADPLAPQDREPPFVQSRQVGVAEHDGPGGRLVQAGGHIQECALA
jgi:hypothetical protein